MIIYTVKLEECILEISNSNRIPNAWWLHELGFNEEEFTGDIDEDKKIIKDFLEGDDLPGRENRLPYLNEYDEYQINFK